MGEVADKYANDLLKGGAFASVPAWQQLHMAKAMGRVREQSGEVDSTDPWVPFLYVLMRDHMPTGVVEDIILECTNTRDAATGDRNVRFTNGWLASYSKDMAQRMADFDPLQIDLPWLERGAPLPSSEWSLKVNEWRLWISAVEAVPGSRSFTWGVAPYDEATGALDTERLWEGDAPTLDEAKEAAVAKWVEVR